MRIPLKVVATYQGGPEAEIWLDARGWRFKIPGTVTLLEAIQALNGQLLGEL